MLASVAGAVAGWAIFSVVTVDVATKNKIITATNIYPWVPEFNWYFLKSEYYDLKASHEEEAVKEGTDWINQQTPIYCDEKIINFRNYLESPLFSPDNPGEGNWIKNPFIFKNTKDPQGWCCVTKSIFNNGDWYAKYNLFYHPPTY